MPINFSNLMQFVIILTVVTFMGGNPFTLDRYKCHFIVLKKVRISTLNFRFLLLLTWSFFWIGIHGITSPWHQRHLFNNVFHLCHTFHSLTYINETHEKGLCCETSKFVSYNITNDNTRTFLHRNLPISLINSCISIYRM